MSDSLIEIKLGSTATITPDEVQSWIEVINPVLTELVAIAFACFFAAWVWKMKRNGNGDRRKNTVEQKDVTNLQKQIDSTKAIIHDDRVQNAKEHGELFQSVKSLRTQMKEGFERVDEQFKEIKDLIRKEKNNG